MKSRNRRTSHGKIIHIAATSQFRLAGDMRLVVPVNHRRKAIRTMPHVSASLSAQIMMVPLFPVAWIDRRRRESIAQGDCGGVKTIWAGGSRKSVPERDSRVRSGRSCRRREAAPEGGRRVCPCLGGSWQSAEKSDDRGYENGVLHGLGVPRGRFAVHRCTLARHIVSI